MKRFSGEEVILAVRRLSETTCVCVCVCCFFLLYFLICGLNTMDGVMKEMRQKDGKKRWRRREERRKEGIEEILPLVFSQTEPV